MEWFVCLILFGVVVGRGTHPAVLNIYAWLDLIINMGGSKQG